MANVIMVINADIVMNSLATTIIVIAKINNFITAIISRKEHANMVQTASICMK